MAKLTDAQKKAAIEYATRDLRAQLAKREEEVRKELEHMDIETISAHVLAEYGLEEFEGKIITEELLKREKEKLDYELGTRKEELDIVKSQTEEEKKPIPSIKKVSDPVVKKDKEETTKGKK
jgi:hypothetical protein